MREAGGAEPVGRACAGTPVCAGLEDVTIALAEGGFLGDSIVDGPGLRCAVFVQGCPHACPGCHNPATHPFVGGREVSAARILEMIKGYPLCTGVTFSGGEPFCRAGALAPLAAALRGEGYELAAYSGFTYEQLAAGTPEQRELLALLDVLVDGPYIEGERDLTLRFRGSRNQRVIDVPASLAAQSAICVREPRWAGGLPR